MHLAPNHLAYPIDMLIVMMVMMPKARAYSAGAPGDVCLNMTPGHGANPQPHDTATHMIEVHKIYNGYYEVSLQPKSQGALFKGFLMQSRSFLFEPLDHTVGTYR